MTDIQFDPYSYRKSCKFLGEYNDSKSSNELEIHESNIKISDPIFSKKTEPIIPKPLFSEASSTTSLIPFEQKIAQNAVAKRANIEINPTWHPPWTLYRVISGHLGWVRCVAVDPSNEWFATGSNDRTIKIWDLASGSLKLSLTGHISPIRGICISRDHCYMYSCAEDKKVLCWDLECNKVIRHYHGHRSGVYSIASHPSLDILFTGGRDCSVRVWDARTQAQIYVLDGHANTVSALVSQAAEPQVISGSHDCTVRLWDIAVGRSAAVLTHHKKSVRAISSHPVEYTFASASSDNIKVFKCPEGQFLRNISGHNAVINTTAINTQNVFVSGADNGTMKFWDWSSGHCFQDLISQPQPGSLDAESGILQMAFDQSGSRLITCEADKTIKLWKEDPNATPETHPITIVKKSKK